MEILASCYDTVNETGNFFVYQQDWANTEKPWKKSVIKDGINKINFAQILWVEPETSLEVGLQLTSDSLILVKNLVKVTLNRHGLFISISIAYFLGFIANSYLFGNSMTPGKSRLFWPSEEYKSTPTEYGPVPKPWIALSGDDDGVHYLLFPKSEDPENMEYDLQVSNQTYHSMTLINQKPNIFTF